MNTHDYTSSITLPTLYTCTECGFMTTDKQVIQDHCMDNEPVDEVESDE